MSKVLVIGCGGVAGVAISKCCQVSEVFTELCIASRTESTSGSWLWNIWSIFASEYPLLSFRRFLRTSSSA